MLDIEQYVDFFPEQRCGIYISLLLRSGVLKFARSFNTVTPSYNPAYSQSRSPSNPG